MIIFVGALYKFQALLPSLYIANNVPTLFRQQLLTIILILFCTASARFAIDYWEKNSQAWRWYVISLGILGLMVLDFMLSQVPGDEFSWAARLMHVAVSLGFIQYLWWEKQER